MRVFKTTWQYIRRYPYQTLAISLVMGMIYFLLTVNIIATVNSQKILDHLETLPQIIAFFKDEVTAEQVNGLKKQLEETGKVASLKYVSKEEALAIYREQNKNDPLLLEMVTANILPSSLEASAKEAKYLSEFHGIFKEQSFVEDVVYQADVVKNLISQTEKGRKTNIILMGSLCISSLFIILIVIAFKISNKKEEIEILRLVGASNWYIRWPFILEGIFYGFLGAIIGWGLSYVFALYQNPSLFTSAFGELALSFDYLSIPSPLFMLAILGIMVASGILIGAGGSLLAVWRYLRS